MSKYDQKSTNSKAVEFEKIFVFSQPCVFKDVSYQPGGAISDMELIEEIVNDVMAKSKGQVNFIEVSK